MGLSLSNIYQRPINPNANNNVRRRQDDSASAANNNEESNENSQSKGLAYVENEQKPQQAYKYDQKFNLPPIGAYNNVNINNPSNVQKSEEERRLEQNRIDSQINIAQILKDFKNTSLAIGTPDDMAQEVDEYLKLIDMQVHKDEPNSRLVKSNLKNAASILDSHISKTLNKESKVVQNWVDSLFLQSIDFHYDENVINERFLVQFPDDTNQTKRTTEELSSEHEAAVSDNPDIIPISVVKTAGNSTIPQDKQLKSLFIQAKKYTYAKDPEKAIALFEQALNRANEIDDTETSGKIYYEVGKIYDDHDYLVQALKSYNQSIKLTTDENVKAKAHYSMAQIYDDVNQITPALDHYVSTVSHAGEAENIPAQSASLTKIGNIYTDMYEKSAFDYYQVAQELADETENYGLRGYVSSNTGNAYIKFEDSKSALSSFSNAAKNYILAESPAKTAQNYVAAADVMVEFNNIPKALNLLKKARKFAHQTEDIKLMSEIRTKLKQLQELQN